MFGLAFLGLATQLRAKPSKQCFDFGGGTNAAACQPVLPTTWYDAARGYGLEPGAQLRLVANGKGDGMRSDALTGDKPFYFSVAVAEGNYRVTVWFGSAQHATKLTVKAELRRLMLEQVATNPGDIMSRSFVVNVRRPAINETRSVRLKDREKSTEWWAWDEKLTLEFNGDQPTIWGITFESLPDIPTVFLLGDSTVCDQPREPYASWGQMLTRFFQPTVAIANHAESGEAVRSSLNAGRFEKVFSLMKRGDYLLLQFGHNDQKEKGEGIGPHASYATDLKKVIAETRKRGGQPVLITSMHRLNFDEHGKIVNTLGEYPAAVRELALAEKVPLIDLNAMSQQLYEALGQADAKHAFKEGDATHHNNFGSYELAQCLVLGIRANKLPLAKHLISTKTNFAPKRPDSWANFSLPASPQMTTEKPLGN